MAIEVGPYWLLHTRCQLYGSCLPCNPRLVVIRCSIVQLHRSECKCHLSEPARYLVNAVYTRTEDTDDGSNKPLTSLIPPASRLNVFPNARFHDYFPSPASACPCIRWVLEWGIPTILSKSWFSGHTRPLCVLAARLVLEKENLVLTFFAPPHKLEQVREDISKQYPESLVSSDMKEKALKRVRLV